MTREQIEKKGQEYYDRFVQYERNPVSNSMKNSIIDSITVAAIEISNAQIDEAISRVNQSMIGPVEKAWILKGLESLKV